ncbi:hypothetical protein KSF73_05400 [Burkholderiaceae bacterium DAT-1]|nr:hypothetical protein [Burkholderiaceae bacterium DAT-1]
MIPIIWLASVHSLSVQAMSMRMEGTTLIVSGSVVPEDASLFADMMTAGQVERVLFRDSRGGDLKAGYSIAAQIESSGVATLLEGRCASSCAIMFMGGKVRAFSANADLRTASLGFHGSHDKVTKAASVKGRPKLYNWLMTRSDQHFSPPLLARAMYVEHANDMLRFLHPSRRPVSVYFCQDGQKMKKDECEPVPEVDALSQGVITTNALISPRGEAFAATVNHEPSAIDAPEPL